MTYGTKYEASVVQTFSTPAVQEQFIWITGGLDKNNEIRKSIQLVSLNGIVFEGPGMIEGIYEHCVVALSYKSVMVIGGKTSSNYQYNATFLYNFETNLWIRGPELLKGRQNRTMLVQVLKEMEPQQYMLLEVMMTVFNVLIQLKLL